MSPPRSVAYSTELRAACVHHAYGIQARSQDFCKGGHDDGGTEGLVWRGAPGENFRKINVEIAHFLLVLGFSNVWRVTPDAKQSSVYNSEAKNFFQSMTGGHSPMSPLWLRPWWHHSVGPYHQSAAVAVATVHGSTAFALRNTNVRGPQLTQTNRATLNIIDFILSWVI